MSDDAIAASCGCSRRALAYWKKYADFQARITACAEKLREAIMTTGIAVKANRIKRINDDWERLKQVREERAADPALADVRGGDTGLIVRDLKGVGKGDDFQLVEVYSVDTGLLGEMRAMETQVAKELGQLKEHGDVHVKAYIGFNPEDV